MNNKNIVNLKSPTKGPKEDDCNLKSLNHNKYYKKVNFLVQVRYKITCPRI
jgi:hypothetical protein